MYLSIHWQVAQATSLQNIHFKMKAGSSQIGLFIENGSGGFVSDLTFECGQSGILCGNQQFTSRDLIFENCKNAITMLWDWGWIWKGLDIKGGDIGINFTTQDYPGGSITVLDSRFSGVKTGILLNQTPKKKSEHQASVSLINTIYQDVGTMVSSQVSNAKLAGGSGRIDSWFIGNVYTDGKTQSGGWSNGKLGGTTNVPDGLRYTGSTNTKYFTHPKEQYSSRSDWIVPSAKGNQSNSSHTEEQLLKYLRRQVTEQRMTPQHCIWHSQWPPSKGGLFFYRPVPISSQIHST